MRLGWHLKALMVACGVMIPAMAGAARQVHPNPSYAHFLTPPAPGGDTYSPRAIPRPLPAKPLQQGNTNGCGTTALAMALNVLAAMSRNDLDFQPFTRDMLDIGNRELNSFIAPSVLVRAARDNGSYAAMYNESTFDEIRQHLDQGHPIIALIATDRDATLSGLHYVLIIDYKDSQNPANRTITYTDPGFGQVIEINYDQFVAENASNIKLANVSTGFDRLIIVLSNKDDLPKSRGIPLTNSVATGINNAINAIGLIKNAVTR